MDSKIAFVSQGKLFLKEPDRELIEIESSFATSAMDRRVRDQQMESWKGDAWDSESGLAAMGPQWLEASSSGRRPMRIRSIAQGDNSNELHYILDMGGVCGVFRYLLDRKAELRLMHKNAFPADNLARNTDGEFAVSLLREDGSMGLAFSSNNGKHWSPVLGGDSLDQAPSWVPETRAVVYQSATVARDENGYYLGLGPFEIEKLELKSKSESETVYANSSHDLLVPKVDADGNLYCIRRPYKPQGHVTWQDHAKDIVLFPYRMAMATVGFLNLFSVLFSGQPIATAQSQKQQQRQQYMRLWGEVIDTKKALAKSDADESLVPKNWELIRRDSAGNETSVATNVACFDLCPDGVVYSNGSKVYHRSNSGKTNLICKGAMIGDVLALE